MLTNHLAALLNWGEHEDIGCCRIWEQRYACHQALS